MHLSTKPLNNDALLFSKKRLGDKMKKHMPLLSFGLIAVISMIAMFSLLDVSQFTEPMIISPPTTTAPKTILISLPFGGRLGQYVPGISEATISGLARGYVQTGEGRTAYTNSIQFNVPGFQGLSSDFRTDYREIGESPKETLFCSGGSNDVWMQYRMDFESGLRSKIDGRGELIDYENEKILLLGGVYSFASAVITANAPNGILELRLMGEGGNIVLRDNPYDNKFTTFGVKINGVDVNIDLQMIGSKISMNRFVLNSITMRFRCEGITGELLIPKNTCASQRLGYHILNPNFDLCFLGMSGASSPVGGAVLNIITGDVTVPDAEFKIKHAGPRQLYINGEGYRKVPLFYSQGGSLMPGKSPTQGMWWVEQGAGAHWINQLDYFILNDRPNSDRAKVKVYQFKGADTTNNQLELRDLSGRTRHIPYDPATGDCINPIPNLGTGARCNYDAATGRLAVDQNGDGTFNGQANWVISSRYIIVNLGPQFPGASTTITYTTLSRRLPEGGPNVVVQTKITAGDPIEQRILDTGTCPLTGDYNYGCMSLRAGTPFNLGNRERGGNIYVGGMSVPGGVPGAKVTVGSQNTATTYTSGKGGMTGIILTFEAGRLRGN